MKRLTAVMLSMLTLLSEASACSVSESDSIFPCTCAIISGKIEVDCSGYGLRSVPENLPERTAVLDFSDNSLQPDSIESLCEYGFLEHVSIARNHLTSIEHKRLRRCDISESLNFSGNPLDIVDKYTLYGLEFTHEFYGLEAREFKENSFTDMFGLKRLEILLHQSKIPANLFKNNHIRILKLNVNGATEIPEKLLSPLNSTLIGIAVTSTSIQTLPAKLLSSLKNLRTCNLMIDELRSLPATFFQYKTLYKTVENISLSGIKSLPRHLFWLLEELRHLEIHGSVDMPSDLFHGLHGLEYLDLSTSTVSTIPAGCFDDLSSLQTLILRDVGLTVLMKADFKDLPTLRHLDVSKNRLRSMTPELFFHISGSVKLINISENILKKVPENLFKQHSVLECLDLSRNAIFSIENRAFYHLSDLKRLHLQSNKLYQLETDMFLRNVNMTYLDLSSNILYDLPGGMFTSTHRLEVFNLSDNHLYNLERSILFSIPTLREINLSFNPIHCDCGIQSVKKILLNVLIIGNCETPQAGIAIVNFVSTANCVLRTNSNSFFTSPLSSTDFLYPSESIVSLSEPKLIISVNDDESKTAQDSKLLSIAITPGNVQYSIRELSTSRINKLTFFNRSTGKIELNDLPITKHKISDSSAAVFITAGFTPAPGHSTSVPEIRKSASVDGNTFQVYSNVWSATRELTVHKTKFNGESYKLGSFTISPDATLQPSFKTASVPVVSHTDSGDYLSETLPEALQTISVLSENDAIKSTDFEAISPTSVYITKLTDAEMMTDGFHTLGETVETSPNVTGLPPIAGYVNITGDPNMAGKPAKSEYFYLSLACIISVAVFCFLILMFLYYKRRRNHEYEFERRGNIFNIDDSFHEDDQISPRASLNPVPSIQIETVDDEGNVKVEIYESAPTQ